MQSLDGQLGQPVPHRQETDQSPTGIQRVRGCVSIEPGRLSPDFLLPVTQPGRFPPFLYCNMLEAKYSSVSDVLLAKRGLIFPVSFGEPLPDDQVRAVELDFGAIGYVRSSRLRARLARCSVKELVTLRARVLAVLLAQIGGDQRHEPLFRDFPNGVPADTRALWWSKVLVHFVQAEGQPCIFCRRTGTTHVLNPCCHVVCDHCFDGANYSACPVCEHHVDRSSPFFQPKGERDLPTETIVFKLLDLGLNAVEEARSLFVSLCERKQALSDIDREVLLVTLLEHKSGVLSWLPPSIPVRENVAVIFGTLFLHCDPAEVLPHARLYMKTATDVLRFIAVLSGTDGSLLRETTFKTVERIEGPNRFWGRIAELLGATPPGPTRKSVVIPLRICRFKTAKLSRPLRRALLGLLEGMDADRLIEDMLRHRSYWVWVGEFLHPHEYATRFPKVARAFLVVRKKAPDGTAAPHFESWYARLEQALTAKDLDAMLNALAERPGELARRLDHVLRVADNDIARRKVIAAFTARLSAFATPVLVTLRSHLPKRQAKGDIRIFWPKGRVSTGVSASDERSVLPCQTVEPVVRAIDAELLNRFASKASFENCLIDERLRDTIVPFNERTASVSAVSLPRGSRVSVRAGKLVRLFLHWCQPKGGKTTDLDLSVAFYDDAWRYVGVCSYYQLEFAIAGRGVIARSAGDLRDAPWPDGATEFVDLHRDKAVAAGFRYAVLVINNYAGLPFSLLERGFAGVMVRDDEAGSHFDPRTVRLKFALSGENGVFLPLVFDLRECLVHWLDVNARGQFEMNNVETSKAAIAKICPELMAYFASGVRPSMFDLALLHAAARSRRVILRGCEITEFVRQADESVEQFHCRILNAEPDRLLPETPTNTIPTLAFLYQGDVDLPEGSMSYALFRERLSPSLAASDLLS